MKLHHFKGGSYLMIGFSGFLQAFPSASVGEIDLHSNDVHRTFYLHFRKAPERIEPGALSCT